MMERHGPGRLSLDLTAVGVHQNILLADSETHGNGGFISARQVDVATNSKGPMPLPNLTGKVDAFLIQMITADMTDGMSPYF
jgi:hypothetical protein